MTLGFHQDITYWGIASEDAYGTRSYATPVLLKGRWEDRQEEFIKPNNESDVSKAVVFFPAMNGLAIGGYLFNGNATAVTDPTAVLGYYILQLVKIPDLRNIRNLVKAIL